MMINTKALIIKQRNLGETDKVFTLLSDTIGIIEVTARNCRNFKKSLSMRCEILCYGDFSLYKSKNKYILNSVTSTETFFDIRQDLDSLSLALYFCELLIVLDPNGDSCGEYINLMLNSFYIMSKKIKSHTFVKFVIQLRLMSISGFMPNFVACNKCGIFEKEIMYFNFIENYILCKDCADGCDKRNLKLLYLSMIRAIRHVIYSEYKKIFSFKIDEKILEYLDLFLENYIKLHTEKNFKSLDFYKSGFGSAR